MAVSEAVARLWGKLKSEQVFEYNDPLSPQDRPLKGWFRSGARRIPDPAMEPWEWLKTLVAGGYVVEIKPHAIYLFQVGLARFIGAEEVEGDFDRAVVRLVSREALRLMEARAC